MESSLHVSDLLECVVCYNFHHTMAAQDSDHTVILERLSAAINPLLATKGVSSHILSITTVTVVQFFYLR